MIITLTYLQFKYIINVWENTVCVQERTTEISQKLSTGNLRNFARQIQAGLKGTVTNFCYGVCRFMMFVANNDICRL